MRECVIESERERDLKRGKEEEKKAIDSFPTDSRTPLSLSYHSPPLSPSPLPPTVRNVRHTGCDRRPPGGHGLVLCAADHRRPLPLSRDHRSRKQPALLPARPLLNTRARTHTHTHIVHTRTRTHIFRLPIVFREQVSFSLFYFFSLSLAVSVGRAVFPTPAPLHRLASRIYNPSRPTALSVPRIWREKKKRREGHEAAFSAIPVGVPSPPSAQPAANVQRFARRLSRRCADATQLLNRLAKEKAPRRHRATERTRDCVPFLLDSGRTPLRFQDARSFSSDLPQSAVAATQKRQIALLSPEREKGKETKPQPTLRFPERPHDGAI